VNKSLPPTSRSAIETSLGGSGGVWGVSGGGIRVAYPAWAVKKRTAQNRLHGVEYVPWGECSEKGEGDRAG